jgi:hypothetical protein
VTRVGEVAQLEPNISALDRVVTPQEQFEIDRCYTPCDVINDDNVNRIPRQPR